MRDDCIGMFWDEPPKVKGKNFIAAVMPDIPDTGWTTPTEFPDLSKSSVISLDTETKDPDLTTKGPGWARHVGHLVGVSLGDDQGRTWYFPIRHEIEPEYNMDVDEVLEYLRKTLGNPKQPKVGANLIYDVGWLQEEGVYVKGPLYDVQYAEALLTENDPVNLEYLGQKYLGLGKASEVLYEWCADYYGGRVNGKQRANIYRTPPRLTGFYAESDADLPLKIIEKQWPLLQEEGLMDVFMMECELIPLYVEMRFAGVTVNIPYAEKLRDYLQGEEDKYQDQLNELVGFKMNSDGRKDLEQAFNSFGLTIPRTKKGNPSFTGKFLEDLDHPIGELIRQIRKHNKLRVTFVQSYILDSHIDGKVHGSFNPLRGEKYGARSGRYSSSCPNLQNIPSKDEILAPMIRGLFIPDVGHKAWRKYDYSQIEYRFLVHFAVGGAGNRARAMFNLHPDLDYHEFAQKLLLEKLGMKISRKAIKGINFGLIYGMGVAALSKLLGLPKAKGAALIESYFKAVDFAKPTMEAAQEEAKKTGVIRTIMGRKSRFDLWEPADYQDKRPAVSLDKAMVAYGMIKRAGMHKALNRKIQGSAADQMKKAMHMLYTEGYFDKTGVPRITVHDELDFSDPGGCDAEFMEIKRVMEEALPLSIPVLADGEIGPDWGHIWDLGAPEAQQYQNLVA